MKMSEKIIEVENLTKKYGDLTAVDNISFDVFRGEIFSLVGPNGAGKTTTVEILECLREPTNGEAKIFDLDISEKEEKIKKRIGVMPQEFNTFERLTVSENIKLMERIYGNDGNIEKILKKLELWEEKDRNFDGLSGGMKRRVGIAMALISDPELLFLDEPTTGLDPQARVKLWDMIKSLKKSGVTIFLTTHYMEEVEELSDRASIMLGGKILSTERVETLISEYGGNVKIVVQNEGGAQAILEEFTDDVFVDENENTVGIFESRKKAAEAHLSLYEQLSEKARVNVVEPSMDDVFLQVAGGSINESGELVK